MLSLFPDEVFQEVPHVGGCFDFAVFFYEISFFIDDEGGSFDAHVFLAVHALFLEDAVKVDDDFIGIREKREVEFVLVPEVAVLLDGVAADAKDDVAEILEVGKVRPEGLCFECAAGGIVLRVEVKDDFLSEVVGEGHIFAAVGGQCEVRRFLSNFQCHNSSPF